MKKKFLFLDDMEERHAALREMTKNQFGWDVVHVYNAADAIKALSEEVYDVASLDHDLSLESIMTEPELGEKSGYDVAMFIAEMPEDKRPTGVIVHSWNPAGAQRMMEALRGKVHAVYLPFKADGFLPQQTDFDKPS